MISNEYEVVNTKKDADLDIVKEGAKSCSKIDTTIMGEDSDLLVLMLNNYSPNFRHQLYFRSDILSQKAQPAMYNIKDILSAIGPELKKPLLFLHAFTGCDTTSLIFGVGKPAASQLLLKCDEFQKCAAVFYSQNQSYDEVESSWKKAVV